MGKEALKFFQTELQKQKRNANASKQIPVVTHRVKTTNHSNNDQHKSKI
jgi:hypothetical protein